MTTRLPLAPLDARAPAAVTAKNPTGTSFCATEVVLWEGVSFWLDGNSKITAENGTYESPVPNALSLPAASVEDPDGLFKTSCPGSTAVCRASCYVKGLAKHAPNVYALYQHNESTLRHVLDDHHDTALSAISLGAAIARLAPGGFRWHVSGDVLNVNHARWIANVCAASPKVRHWIYTRTFEAVECLVKAPNLAVNVSADSANLGAALAAAARWGTRICYMTDPDGTVPASLPVGSVIFPDYPARGRALAEPTEHPWWQGLSHEQRKMVCSTDFFGQSDAHRCAMNRCNKCLVR